MKNTQPKQKSTRQTNSWSSKIWRLFSNSTFQFCFAIVLSIVLYSWQKNEMDLSYFAEYETVLATKTAELKNDMRIFWHEQELENLRVKRFIFANLGNKHIDSSDLIDNRLLQIQLSPNCQVLSASILKQSRPELALKMETRKRENMNEISVSITNREVIEQKDGLYINIFYTGKNSCVFTPKARIKGKLGALNNHGTNVFLGIKYSFRFFLDHFVTLFSLIGYFLVTRAEKTLNNLSEHRQFLSTRNKLLFRSMAFVMLIVFLFEMFTIYRDFTDRLPWL